ncbi:HK97 family phage prohead protease [Litorisediminicola beolgyonensis]|uniref:HK97 family phage prohead protease n=1 Tax=Litorisediminicola beolgyonensis TaxID=1173614 RepID=A0ABW3ZN27_9RHOB
MDLEHKFCRLDGAGVTVTDEAGIEGYASLFGETDQGGDAVAPGAYAASLARLTGGGRSVKLLWQHDPAQPIGVWDEIREDARGLFVRGRLLPGVARACEALELLRAGAIDGLSIGYRTRRARKTEGGGRLLTELELWEVSLVTFPMLSSARVAAKGDDPETAAWRGMAQALGALRREMAGG